MAYQTPSPARPPRTLKPVPGFTLVELLIAMATGLLVVGSALLALSSSFSSWSRIAGGGILLETDRAMLRFERDIASALPLPDCPFSGDATSLTLPLEHDGALRVATWSAEESLLVRQERDYLFGDEAAFDGHGPDGLPLPVRTERYRLPETARFLYEGAGAPPPPSAGVRGPARSPSVVPPSFVATAPTNLPRTVTLSIGDFIRHCPTRLSAPDTP